MNWKDAYCGTGRRKTASARVFIKPAQEITPVILVNKIDVLQYFPEASALDTINQPLVALNLKDKYDIYATVKGGGKSGQKGAVRLGLTRALLKLEQGRTSIPQEEGEDIVSDDLSSFKKQLKNAGKLTTTDARQVERKKYGQDKARKKAPHRKR